MIPYKNVLGVGYILLAISNIINMIIPLLTSTIFPISSAISLQYTLSMNMIGYSGLLLLSLLLAGFALILISLGWILIGKCFNNDLWILTGLTGILTIGVALAIISSTFYLSSIAAVSVTKLTVTQPMSPEVAMKVLKVLCEVVLPLAIVLIVLASTFYIGQLASLWTAGGRFAAPSLKAASVLLVLAFVIELLTMPTVFSTYLTALSIVGKGVPAQESVRLLTQIVPGMTSYLYWMGLASSILTLASYLIAGVVILTLKR